MFINEVSDNSLTKHYCLLQIHGRSSKGTHLPSLFKELVEPHLSGKAALFIIRHMLFFLRPLERNLMKTRCLFLRGDFSAQSLHRYLAVFCAVFWGLIFAAWLGYPRENSYSILTHTFSFLGSYELKHSPTWWWLFSVGLIFWSVAGIPLILYIYRRFARISLWGARIAALFQLIGSVNIALVGLFPDVNTPLSASLKVTDVHEKVAILAAAMFILAIILHGLLLLKGRYFDRNRSFNYRYFLPLYALWFAILLTATYFLIKWEYVYARLKAAAAEQGTSVGSSWSEALNTIYSFPLWENILIYSLFCFMVIVALLLSKAENTGGTDASAASQKK